jgi:hypothetical protein
MLLRTIPPRVLPDFNCRQGAKPDGGWRFEIPTEKNVVGIMEGFAFHRACKSFHFHDFTKWNLIGRPSKSPSTLTIVSIIHKSVDYLNGLCIIISEPL